ncbi:unnamed protein product [Periconia digitata]|uniref:USP domain-containing protein n=1 Tax=Periconia digitata TaxID=1303443 RepID=A0A9W4XN19_9PLEO|nr:unnamed protein product [Periconia digitata]
MSVAGDDAISSSNAASPPSPLPNPPQDSMEIANRDHKRRRLNSESKDDLDILAMSTDRSVPDSPSVPHLTLDPSDQQVEMTIRSQPPSSSNPQEQDELATTSEDVLASDTVHVDTNDSPLGGGDASADSPPVIELLSDTDEAANDDDDDDDDDVEIMADYTPSGPIHIEYDVESYFLNFPYTKNDDFVAAVVVVTNHFHANTHLDGAVLPSISVWLDGIPDQPLPRKAFFTEKAPFWDEFSNFIFRLLSRRIHFGDTFSDDQGEEDIFFTLFTAYVRVCVHLIQADAQMLSEWSASEPCSLPIVAYKHVRNLLYILRPERTALFHLLNKDYGINVNAMSNRLLRLFLETGGLPHLLDMADHECSKAPPMVLTSIAAWTAPILEAVGWHLVAMPATLQPLQRIKFNQDVLHFFQSYDVHLQIPGQVVDMTVARDAIGHFSSLLLSLCQWDDLIARELVDHMLDFKDPESPTATISPAEPNPINEDTYRRDPALYPVLVHNAWKFKLLRKYIVKGRMELRVMSIGAMDHALVDIWREYNTHAHSIHHPVMQYLADFLLDQKVVNYIISVDSHPQLISRSGNIVGFLVVTRRYSEGESDAIWNTVSNSSDPRVVSATMTMLRSIINLMQNPELLYLLTKLYDIPIDNCTLDVIRFQRDIAGKINCEDWSEQDFKSRPWNVSVRMLQDTSPTQESSKATMALHMEASEQLSSMTHLIWTEERHSIYRSCAEHIECRSSKATGSVHAVWLLATTSGVKDVGFFEENPELTRRILEETCAYIGEGDGIAFGTMQQYAAHYRLDLLCFLIQRATTAIPIDLYESIWDHLIGKYAHKDELRDIAWTKFLQAMRFRPNNEFCTALISTYVPKLDPKYYTPGLLEFVAAYNFATERQMVETMDGEKQEALQVPGAHLLWPMILSAPPRTIEDRTANLLANRYLEVDPVHGITLPDMEAAHMALVEKCIHEILSSYRVLRGKSSRGDDEMDVTVTAVLKQQNERRLTRTVLFLKLLLMSIRTRADFNRSRRSDSKVEALEDEDRPDGEVVEVRYQSGTNEKQSIIVGTSNTMQDVYRRLCHATGYSKINIFHKGRKIDLNHDRSKTVGDLDLTSQNLQVQKAQGSEIIYPTAGNVASCSVFETALLDRFEELFTCMDAEDAISATLYDLLVHLPFQERIFKSVTTGTISAADLFPPDRLYQAKYAAYALHWKLEQQLRSTLDENYLANAVQILEKALLNPSLILDASSSSHVQLAGVVVQVLLKFLKGVSSSYFSNNTAFVERLLELVSLSLVDITSHPVALASYATIIEASLHSRGVWDAFVTNNKSMPLHRKLLLDEPHKELRQGIAKVISSVCGGGLSPSSALTETETASSFWKMISPVLPYVVEHPDRSLQIFQLADEVFRKYDESNRDEATLRSYLSTWSDVLLHYRQDEEVGQGEVDFVVHGFSKLLLSCISSLKSLKKPLDAGQLVERLWSKFLFVPKVVDLDEQASSPEVPVLESNTRKQLLDLVLALADDRNSYNKLLELAGDLGTNDTMISSFDVDREDMIRSPTGYLGLNNPRAICYMNSLLAQLFMNVNFRKFMLRLDVAEPAASQRLLHDTQTLFSTMQNSYRKWADPQEFAACVRVPDGGSIDINIQMDADEFYNLLFDQWEAQMLSPEDKAEFRSFYGGQTVNQIKSKECEHVSERLESFFVVQCDVQGKSNLHESLQAFVEGDVMEGENKYKCESCGGKLVDAVKRTCLKQVPDNLIFHLKRFDFDLVTLSRAKINDYFDFPSTIDVSPYKIDHLSDPSQTREEDWFELVGVLVHQGSSEAGHYYSYIRTRPDLAENVTRWSEFNDRDVDAFDPQYIPSRAFGGLDDKFQRQLKNYSAYMLFYQRRSAIAKDRMDYINSLQCGNVKVPIPSNMNRQINIDNDRFIRDYCVYDPYHTKFLRQTLSNLRTINQGTCSEDHVQETQALHIMLKHLFHVHIRARAPENFEETLLQLRKIALSCSTCCLVVMRWFADDDSALLNMLLLCEAPKVRLLSRAFLIDCLRFLRDREPGAYGIENMEMENDNGSAPPVQGVLSAVVAQLRVTADNSYLAVRNWDDFYLTLCQICDLSRAETAALLDEGFLTFCLKIFCMPVIRSLQTSFPGMWKVTEKRKRIYNRMIEFVYGLLCKTDCGLHNAPNARTPGASRYDTFDPILSKFAISSEERRWLFHWYEDNRAYAALDRILETFDANKTEIFYPGEILRLMLNTPDDRAQHQLFLTVYDGVVQFTPPHQDPYVRAALSYCKYSSQVIEIMKVADAVVKKVARCSKYGGEAHLHFFAGLLHVENNIVSDEKGEDYFYRLSLMYARKIAVPLLMNDDENVRNLAVTHFADVFTEEMNRNSDNGTLELKYHEARSLASELQLKIEQEHEVGSLRGFVQPMIVTCTMLVGAIFKLYQVDDPVLNRLKSDSDESLIDAQRNLDVILRNWSFDEATPQSMAEGFDQSDYGSESDVDADAEPYDV